MDVNIKYGPIRRTMMFFLVVVAIAIVSIACCICMGGKPPPSCANKKHFDLWKTNEVGNWAHPKPKKEILQYFIANGLTKDSKKGKSQPPKYCQQCVDVVHQTIVEEQMMSDDPGSSESELAGPSSTFPGASVQVHVNITSEIGTSDTTDKKSSLQTTGIFSDLGSKLVTVQSSLTSRLITVNHHAHSWWFGNAPTCAGHVPKPVIYQPPSPPEEQFPPPPPGWGRNVHADSAVYYRVHSFPWRDPVINKSLTVFLDKTYKIRLFGRDVPEHHLDGYLKGKIIHDLKMDIPQLLGHLISMQLCAGYTDDKYHALCESWTKDKHLKHVFNDTFMDGNKVVNSSVRGADCLGYVSGTGVRCNNCSLYGNTLRPAFKRHEISQKYVDKRIAVQSHVSISSLTELEAKNRARKYAKLQKKLKATIRSLRKKLSQCIQNEGEQIEPDMSRTLLQTMTEYSGQVRNQLPENSFGRLFWEEQLKAAQVKDKRGHRWHPMIIKWALNLRLSSGKAYRTIRGSNFLQLPHETTLRQYLHWTKPTSGFNVNAVEQLLREMKYNNLEPYQKHVALIHDEMKIKSDLVFRKDTGELVGFTDLSNIQNNLRNYEAVLNKATEPEENIAKYMLVFLVRGLFINVLYPLAHFPTSNTKSDEIFALSWKAIEMLELAGLTVVSVTCDGASTNRRFFDMHKEAAPDQQQPIHQTPNPYQENRDIYLMADPPHLVKCVRNAWESKTRDLWNDGPISWRVIKDLYQQRQQMRGFYLAKLTYEHVYLTTFSKMKVRLAVQVLSQTIANALPEVEAPTKKFVLIFDKFFDLLNVRSRMEGGKKRKPNVEPYYKEQPEGQPEDERLQWLTVDFIKYLDDWEKLVNSKENLSKTEKAKLCIPQETLIGLRRSALAYAGAVEFLLQQEGVKFVLTERFNQDPLESLFGNMRQMRGGNDAPTVQQFNESINAARLKNTQTMRNLGGNTHQRQHTDQLPRDDTQIPRRKRAAAASKAETDTKKNP